MPRQVTVEGLIFEAPRERVIAVTQKVMANPDIVLRARAISELPQVHVTVDLPDEATAGVPPAVYDAARLGLTTSCADVVLLRGFPGQPEKPPMILMTKRARPPFGDCWWIQGGAVFVGFPVQHFLLWKLMRETGQYEGSLPQFVKDNDLKPDQYSLGRLHIVGPLGLYRTIAPDMVGTGKVCDTINSLYMAVILEEIQWGADKDHTVYQWVYYPNSEECGHHYPADAGYVATMIYLEAVA